MHAFVDWSRRHPVSVDTTFAAILALISGIGGQRGGGHPIAPMLVVFALALCLPLALRRRYPTAVFLVIAGAAFVEYLSHRNVGFGNVAILIALYTLAAHRGLRRTISAAAIVELGIFLAAFRWSEKPWGAVLSLTIVAGAAIALGESMRVRRAYFVDLELRAERLERERDQQMQIATAAERARIAREMHDIVAHHVSVIVAQADGAAYAIHRNPEQARTAMHVISQTGRESLREMRRLLGVLRTNDGANVEPQPGMRQVPDLVERLRQTGLGVDLHIDERALDGLPAGLELAAYRIVQEALTNTFKHAGIRSHASVDIAYVDEMLAIEVLDDGRANPEARHRTPQDATGSESGQGLIGMRERAAMYGGTLVTKARPEGGYRVVAVLPLVGAS